jgi:putative glutamine amidotransferase
MDNGPRNKTKKPVIGVIPLFDDGRDSIWMLPGYMDGILAAGGLPVILPFTGGAEDTARVSGMIDGLLLTGGHDVDPLLYNETPIELREKPSKARDALEYALLGEMLRLDKPVFGICRGIQLLNVYFGGTLYQDIPTQLENALRHSKPPGGGNIATHDVRIATGTPLYDILGKQTLTVNSYHHQGVKRLAEGLKPMARAQDGLVEAVCVPGRKFAAAVQWHPELSFKSDEDELALFKAFVSACG